MRLTRATHKAIDYACRHFHYAAATPFVIIGYNVYNDNDEWCGVVLFGNGATPNIGKPYGLVQGQTLELVRVALNGKQELTSQCISMALKKLHKDKPMCRLVVSYADIDQSHLGTIYQATNWIYTGETCRGGRYFIINGEKTHPRAVAHICEQSINAVRQNIDPTATEFRSRGKHRYLMPMDKRMRRQLQPMAQPYPKNDGWTKIDRNQYKTMT